MTGCTDIFEGKGVVRVFLWWVGEEGPGPRLRAGGF